MKLNKNKKAFSVAEAMITLLIVSIALSAIAPIFSKRNAAKLNNVSKWENTASGNIVRTQGRVGIGMPVTQEPSAGLEINIFGYSLLFGSSETGSSDVSKLLSFKNNDGAILFDIDKNGKIILGDTGNKDEAVMKLTDNSGKDLGGFKLNGDSSFIPEGAVMFFDSTTCPTGWKPLTDKYSESQGIYIKNIGVNSGVPESVGTITPANNIPKEATVGAVGGPGDATKIYTFETDKEVVPKTISLLACRKEKWSAEAPSPTP